MRPGGRRLLRHQAGGAGQHFRWLLVTAAALLLMLSGTPGAVAASQIHVLDERRVSERMVDVTVWSPALRGRAYVRLLLPMHYRDRPEASWPSLYLLHGCCDSYLSWTRSTDIEQLSAAREVLVVMPDGGRVGFYSDWLNGPAWERFHTEELPQLLTSRYRASDRRAVAGNSMGGLGALTYTARHPGLFAAAASFSGIVHTRLSGDESRSYLGLIDSEGEQPYALWGAPTVDQQIWAAHNPYDLAQNLLTTPLFISVGNGQPGPLNLGGSPDRIEEALHAENVAYRTRLTQLGAAATFDFYGRGSHDWPYWQRELHGAWPILTNALA
jgi:diacylglycerol O-acyltransferase / trehalose O-mycolyltransferase / mycolyltransferase Ag85